MNASRHFVRRYETGVTLPETIIAIVLIAILSSIAIFVGTEQRKRAVDAATVTDVRNIATQIKSHPRWITQKTAPTYTMLTDEGVKASPGTVWGVSSNASGFCIVAYNTRGKQYTRSTNQLTYDSASGGLNKSGAGCGAGETYVGSSVIQPATATTVYSCNTGDTLSGSTCTSPSKTYTAYSSSTYVSGYYYCPYSDAPSLSGSRCLLNRPYWGDFRQYAVWNTDSDPNPNSYWPEKDTWYYGDYASCGSQYTSTYKEYRYWGYTGNGIAGKKADAYNRDWISISNWSNGTYYPVYGYTSGLDTGCIYYKDAAYQSSYSSTSYYCDTGDSRSGTTCTRPSRTYAAASTITYSCPSTAWTYDSVAKTCTRAD